MLGWLPVLDDEIPAELRTLGWVLWRAELRTSEKPSKVPYCVAEPTRRASSTSPTTWATFHDALEAYTVLVNCPPDPERGPIAGVGAVLTLAAEITCIDLDHVLDGDGHLDSRAQTIVQRCESWTERSPSGTGLHVFVRGRVPRALKGLQIEVYSDARYIAVTGHRWADTPGTLRHRQPYLDHLIRVEAESRPARSRAYTGPAIPPPDDLAGALLARLAAWSIPVALVKPWSTGYLVELAACPWADEHTSGPGGAAVMIHASGAFDFTCLHAHCAGRTWRDFRLAMESRS